MEKVQKTPLLAEGQFKVINVTTLNFFDLTGEKANTKGTSCKQYIAELHESLNNSSAQIYTMYGPTGGNQVKEWRHYSSLAQAQKEYGQILNSKRKKGYKDIDVAQRAYGTEAAKAITKPVQLKNAEHLSANSNPSKLHKETQRLIASLFGSTNQFVIQTLRCPLGQLTNNQIDEGRNRLNAAKKIVSAGSVSKTEKNKLLDLTNEFYGLIPHNLGAGFRGKMENLILDDLAKINQKEDDLDTLLDAKSVGAVLATGTNVDDQYKALNTEFEFVDKNDPLFKWIDSMVQDTRAHNHNYLGKIVVLNAWRMTRNNEFDTFITNSRKIAKECGGRQNTPKLLEKLVANRKDIGREHVDIYRNANVLPLFHGTKTQNIVGITKKGLLIRPAGVSLTGAMFGSGCIYFGNQSSKSIGYTNIKSSYWAGGKDDTAYLFIVDCTLGKQKIAHGPYNFTKDNIKPHHSVYAVGGKSGVINDEFMLYDTNQHHIRYFLEFTCRQR